MEVKIHRYDAEGGRGWVDTYQVDTSRRSMTVMDVLEHIASEQDPTLAFYRHSTCDHGICGRCTLMINGEAKLACITLADGYESLELAPMRGLECVRDLVVRRQSR